MRLTFDGRYGVQTSAGYAQSTYANISPVQLRQLICESTPIGHPWGEATLTRSTLFGKRSVLLLASGDGYFLQSCTDDLISCWDRNRLRQIVCPDDFEVPAGCIVPVDPAWQAILYFVKTGERSDGFEWIAWDDIPKDAKWSFDQ